MEICPSWPSLPGRCSGRSTPGPSGRTSVARPFADARYTSSAERAVHSKGGASHMSVTVQDLRAWKFEGRRFAMLTAYDYPTAKILDEAGIPVLLVGDTLAEVQLGYDTTLPVTMDAMI